MFYMTLCLKNILIKHRKPINGAGERLKEIANTKPMNDIRMPNPGDLNIATYKLGA